MSIYRGTVTPGEMDWKVTVNGSPLPPRLDLRNHSPDGFAWGYGGSGPAQLSLAPGTAALRDDAHALRVYQKFKAHVIAVMDSNASWRLTEAELLHTIEGLE